MPDIDPITREALRRASQMHTHSQRTHRPPKEESRPEPEKPHKHEHKPPKPQPSEPPKGDPIKAFFKDKEESIILLLVLLLMDEKADPSLLLALMYLLI